MFRQREKSARLRWTHDPFANFIYRSANPRRPRCLWDICVCVLENSQSKSREHGDRVRSHCSHSSVLVWSYRQDSQLAGLGAHLSRAPDLPSVPSDYVLLVLAGS